MSEVILGINPILEALKVRPHAFKKILIAHGRSGERLKKILDAAQDRDIEMGFKDRDSLTALAKTRSHQGIVAILKTYQYAGLEEIIGPKGQNEPRLILILDGIEDPQNLGSLVRSAHAAGTHGIFIPKHRAAPVTAVVNKTSAGALEHTLVARVTNLVSTIKTLKKEGMWIVGITMEAEKTIYDLDLSTDIVLVIGSEGRGIRPLIKRHCDILTSIPMRGKVSSLNAAMAGAIALFEVLRQRLNMQRPLTK